MGTLFIVATPIGNLEDLTLRALRVLKQVGLIAAEDTRKTRRLLAHYKIQTPLTSYFEQNKLTKLDAIIATLREKDVALVSEAGTPGLSDPGYELVRTAIAEGFSVVPIPGASAPIAALVASGLPTDRFLYLGFLPRRREERRRFLAEVAEEQATLVAFEAPHRLRASLADLAELLGSGRRTAIVRELTKLHEEIWRGTLGEALRCFEEREPRGEFTLVIEGAPASRAWQEAEVRQVLRALLGEGVSRQEAARQVAQASGWARRQVYALALLQGLESS
jgi:16S rRNA (cytidine1402-2'-O)-methyltransferase